MTKSYDASRLVGNIERIDKELLVDFGEMPEEINELLQTGVMAYRTDKTRGETLFRQALAQAPDVLPVYLCLYKIHTYGGRLDDALEVAKSALSEAAKQAGLSSLFQDWTPAAISFDGPGRFALYTLKALSFIHLRRDERDEASALLDLLSKLDPTGLVGWPVIAALLDGCYQPTSVALRQG